MELGLAGTDVAPTAADNLDVEGSPYNRSASCDLVFAGTKYVDHILHKVLAKCDSVNKYYAYHGKPHSTATLIQALDNWCTSQHGSTTTIIDADEQQCSSGSGAYNVVTVGYVNKYGDLLAVYNASGGGQTKSAWGKNHYCNNGRTEGRTYSGLSAASCSSTTATTTTTTTSSSAESCYGDYVRKYPDLLAVYNSSVVTKVLKHGVSRTTSIMDKRRDAQLVLRLQRVQLQLLHVVGRVEFTTTYVSTMNVQNSRIGHDAGHQQEYKCPERRDQSGERVQWWPTVSFSFVGSAPAQGIQIMGYSSQYRNACGWAVPYMYSSGEYAKCKIYVNSDIGNMNCTHADLMEHEIGHCSGFTRHTDDKTVMNKYVGVGPRTSAVTNMIGLLYSLSPGKNISLKLTSNYSRSPKSSIAYEKNERKLTPLGIYFTEENK